MDTSAWVAAADARRARLSLVAVGGLAFTCSQAALPVVRITVEVHDGQNEYAMRLKTVQDPVREPVNQASPHLRLNLRPHRGILEGVLYPRVDLACKVKPEA